MKVITIGTSPKCDVVLNSKGIEACHCQIIQEDDGGYALVDFSANGTFLNNKMVHKGTPVKLHEYDILRIGNSNVLPWKSYFSDKTKYSNSFVSNTQKQYQETTPTNNSNGSGKDKPFYESEYKKKQNILNIMNTHILNEKLKRLEPINAKCLYCDTGYSQNMEDNCFIPIYKENDRTNVIVYRNVKYSKILVGVARCLQCKKIHKTTTIWTRFLGVILGIVLSVIFLYLLFSWFQNPFIIVIVLGIGALIGVGLGIGYLIEGWLVRRRGILTKEEGAMKYGIVRDLINDGWTFNKPTA